jgi:tetratricopeptide (TPR) repeat protein
MQKIYLLLVVLFISVATAHTKAQRQNNLQREIDSLKLELRLRDIDQRTNHSANLLATQLQQQDKAINNIQDQIDRWVSFTEVFFGVVGVIIALAAFFGFRQIKQYSELVKRDQEEMEKIVTQSKEQQQAIKARHEELQKLKPEEALSSHSKKIIDETLVEARKQLEKSGFDALKNLYNAKALKAYDKKDWDTCVRYSENYLDFDENNVDVLNILVRSFGFLGNEKKALDTFKRAISVNPKSAGTYNNYAIALHQFGKTRDAIVHLNQVLSIDSKYYLAYINRGYYKALLGDAAAGLIDSNKAVELAPAVAESYLYRGLVYERLGNMDKALEDYNKAIELNANVDYGYNLRAWLEYKAGNFTEAITNANKDMELDPNNANPHYLSYLCYISLGDKIKAVNSLQKAVELEPDNTDYQKELKKFNL